MKWVSYNGISIVMFTIVNNVRLNWTNNDYQYQQETNTSLQFKVLRFAHANFAHVMIIMATRNCLTIKCYYGAWWAVITSGLIF